MDEMAADTAQTESLLARVRAGDRRAFDQLFALHRPYLHRVVELRMDQRLRSRVDPSDVVQEAQMEAYRRLPDYFERRPMTFRLWLRKTAHERLLMLRRFHLGAGRRAAGREVPLPEESSVQLARKLLAPGPSPSQYLQNRERARRVREAVARLPETDREVLVMRNLEALSNLEVAEVLQIDPATASRRYGKALLRLRKILMDCGLMGGQL
jgi:RNA polymerase sigma-70 factor (ECF subfamily)